MMKKKNLLVFVCFLLTGVAAGQGALKFEKETHDFGNIAEEDGPVETTFSFVNSGDAPVRITGVKASCGCTTPGWSKEEVMPGDTGFVKARYNPRNRPGRFSKSLRISTTVGQKIAYIRGVVKPRVKSPEEEFSVALGSLRLKYRSLNMGKMTTEKVVEKSFDVYNAGIDTLALRFDLMEIPGHMAVGMVPSRLGPKQRGKLFLKFDPAKKNDFGFLSDNITLQTDSVVTEKNQLNVISTIEEYFPEMSAEELDEAPKLQISQRVFDFGKVKAGEVVKAEFELSNAGKSKLNFRKIKSNCNCVTYDLRSNNIKKGKSQILTVIFDTAGKRGNQYKTVSLFSNDPTAPTQMITLKGAISKDEDK